MGRRDQPDVGADGLRAAKTLEFVLLKHAQQLGLQFRRNVADLVQEQRALVRQFEASDPLVDGAGESAAFMPEEFAFEQPEGDGGAIHLHEGLRMPGADVVNHRSHHSLAGTGFTEKQNGGIGGTYNIHQLQGVLQTGAFPHHFAFTWSAVGFVSSGEVPGCSRSPVIVEQIRSCGHKQLPIKVFSRASVVCFERS